MNWFGIVMGLLVLLFTGLGHILVVKCEYYFSVKCWPVFLLLGIGSLIASAVIDNSWASGALGIFGVLTLWSVHELFKQVERVAKGWFPKNAKR